MAATNPLKRQPTTFSKTIFFNSFVTVMGTCRVEATTGRRNAGDRALIKPYQEQSDCFHDYILQHLKKIHGEIAQIFISFKLLLSREPYRAF